MNNAKRERVKRIIKCMKFQLIFNRLLINLQLKWLINGCSTYWYIYECIRVWATKWFNRYADRSDQTNKSTRMTNGRSCQCRAGNISNNNTHTHNNGKEKGKSTGCRNWRNDSLRTLDMVTIIERVSEVWARNVWEMLANICLKSTNQQGENGATNQGQRGGEKNFMWQVKWKFLHKSKLKVLKIAKGLKLNFTILTSAKGCSKEGGKESSLFFFWLCYLGNPSHSHCPHPSCATVKRVRLTFMCCCCSCFAGLYFYLLVGFCVFCVWRSHSFSFVVFALWANFWLLVGFQICGKSEVRRKLNELAPALGASAASHCPSAFPCCLSVCASFIYLHAVCFSASSPQHFHAFFCLWFCIWRYVFFSLCPFTHFFPRFPVFFMV